MSYTITLGSCGTVHVWPTDEPATGLTVGKVRLCGRKIEKKAHFATEEEKTLNVVKVNYFYEHGKRYMENYTHHERPAVPIWLYPEESEESHLSEHQRLFDHSEFGEGFLAMAYHQSGDMKRDVFDGHRITYMDNGFTNLERQIHDDCALASGKVVAPHEIRTDGPAYYLRPSYLMRAIQGIDAEQAEALSEDLQTLNATLDMVKTFSKWMKGAKLISVLKYFANLAAEMKALEPAEEPNLVYIEDESETASAPSIIGFHLLESDEDGLYESGLDWLSKQPPAFQSLIKGIQFITSYKSLMALGKAQFDAPMTRNQSTCFWGFYKAQKAKLESAELSPIAQKFLAEIEKRTAANLGSYGQFLYNVQAGRINAPAPTENDWARIWAAYKAKKDATI